MVTAGWRVLLGYGPITGGPPCPCKDGNHVAVEQCVTRPLELLFRCWCGATLKATADSLEEVATLAATRTVPA